MHGKKLNLLGPQIVGSEDWKSPLARVLGATPGQLRQWVQFDRDNQAPRVMILLRTLEAMIQVSPSCKVQILPTGTVWPAHPDDAVGSVLGVEGSLLGLVVEVTDVPDGVTLFGLLELCRRVPGFCDYTSGIQSVSYNDLTAKGRKRVYQPDPAQISAEALDIVGRRLAGGADQWKSMVARLTKDHASHIRAQVQRGWVEPMQYVALLLLDLVVRLSPPSDTITLTMLRHGPALPAFNLHPAAIVDPEDGCIVERIFRVTGVPADVGMVGVLDMIAKIPALCLAEAINRDSYSYEDILLLARAFAPRREPKWAPVITLLVNGRGKISYVTDTQGIRHFERVVTVHDVPSGIRSRQIKAICEIVLARRGKIDNQLTYRALERHAA